MNFRLRRRFSPAVWVRYTSAYLIFCTDCGDDMKKLFAPLTALAVVMATPGYAQNVANLVFLVDESGSMSTEHAFIDDFVSDLDPALAINGFDSRNYALLGFGSSIGTGPANLREFTIGTGQFGTPTEFATATQGLVTSGGTEDGYAAINAALVGYTLPTGAKTTTTYVLITDEDRDNTDNALTFGSVLADIQASGATLVSVVNLDIRDNAQNSAISTDGTSAFVQNGRSFSSNPFGGFSGGAGTTEADYAALALQTNGCVADLNKLRAGGDEAAAFAAAFQTCVLNAASSPAIVAIFQSLNLPFAQSALSVADQLRIGLRMVALAMSNSGTGGFFSTQDQGVVDNMLGVEGLRGYAQVSGSSGSLSGGFDTNGRFFTVGTDYTQEGAAGVFRFGAAIAMGNSSAKNNTSTIDTEAKMGSNYALYRTNGGLQVLGNLLIGDTDQDTARIANAATVTGATTGEYKSLSFEVGQRFSLDGSTNNILTPYLGVARDNYEVANFTDSSNAVVPGFDMETNYVKLGLRYENVRQVSFGRLYTEVDLAWNRVTSEDITVKSGGTVGNTPAATDKDRFDLALNFGVETGPGSILTVSLAGTNSDNVRSGTLGLGIEMNF